jgi:hypothetical protein
VVILGRLSTFVKKQPVKGIIDSKNRKVLEILLNTLYRQDLFDEGLIPYLVGSLSDPLGVSPLRVDLPDPSCITVACHPDQDTWVKITKEELLEIRFYRIHRYVSYKKLNRLSSKSSSSEDLDIL